MEFVTNTFDVSSLGTQLTNKVKALPGHLTSAAKSALGWLPSNNTQTEVPLVTDTARPHIPATLTAVTLETHDTKSYFFQPSEPLNAYKAGSHINIAFEVDASTVSRTYTLSSSPKHAAGFTITVKRVTGGQASNWLFDNLNVGDQLLVSQPQGDFVLPYQPAGKLLMLSAGSGITPVMSMLRYLTETGNRSDILFLHYAQSPDDIIFQHELKTLAANHTNISVHCSVERGSTTDALHQGRISKQQLATIVPDILEREVYLCGPQPFMKATLAILNKLAFDPTQLHLENFTADLDAAVELGYSAALTFTSLDRSIQATPSKTLLQEAEAVGLQPAAACRMGICRTCRCKKQSGTTINLVTGEESSQENDYILPCVSVAKTATVIEL